MCLFPNGEDLINQTLCQVMLFSYSVPSRAILGNVLGVENSLKNFLCTACTLQVLLIPNFVLHIRREIGTFAKMIAFGNWGDCRIDISTSMLIA
jgi:hypothetical protein